LSQFGDLYSKYYDLLYQDKDYNAEVDYIIQLIQKYPNKIETILDLGCGTGKHDKILCDKGYTIHGVDISEEMLNIAELRRKGRESELTFSQSDITQLELGKKFDVIVSLFHVMSYQNTNDLLDRVFSVAINHLNKGGLFIFDFWYGPAVLADPPRKKIKKLENEIIQITRITETQMLAHLNRVDVSFNISVKNIKDNTEFKKKELHQMRFFFDTELEMLCDRHGFQIDQKYEWLTNKKPSFKTWSVVWVVIKK
tara:strand:- start:4660 stop:5421 length:762 start_codon:yes stop_codon:yes gene_type:complete